MSGEYYSTSLTSKANRLKQMTSDSTDTRHGTNTGYIYGCRCEPCTQAGREYTKQKQELKKLPRSKADMLARRDAKRAKGYRG